MIIRPILRTTWLEVLRSPIRLTLIILLLVPSWLFALLGKSSIEYLNPDDKERPKSQSYKGFADACIWKMGQLAVQS